MNYPRNQINILIKTLILAGITLVVVVILVIKNQPMESPNLQAELPETQYNYYLDNGRPMLAFFHSNNCKSCIDMINIIDDVYPEYKDAVALVDVNVHDKRNDNLLHRAKIIYIPTLIFYDHQGKGTTSIGVLTPDELRQRLNTLKGTP